MSCSTHRIARLALCLSIAAPLARDARAEPTLSRPSPVLELADLMTPAELRGAGLDRLSTAERAALDEWVGWLVVRVLTARRRAGCAVPIETRVSGDFEGWSGGTVFALENDQVWRQRGAASTYTYRYSPRVAIHDAETGCMMAVDGVEGEVPVERIW